MNTNCARHNFFGANWVRFSLLYKQKLHLFPGCVYPCFVLQYVDFSHTWLTLITNKKSILVPPSSVFWFYTLCTHLDTRFSCSFNCQTRDASIFQFYPFVLRCYVCKFLLLFSLTDSMSFTSGSICTLPCFCNMGFVDYLHN